VDFVQKKQSPETVDNYVDELRHPGLRYCFHGKFFELTKF